MPDLVWKAALATVLGGLLSQGALSQQPAVQQPIIQFQGQPYSGGTLTLHVFAEPGQPALFLYGRNPLDPPLGTSIGLYYIGNLSAIVALGVTPPSGPLDVTVLVPIVPPSVAGIPLIGQAYVSGALSNPVALPLDQPYLTSSAAVVIDNPLPSSGASFGNAVAAGDFNDDGIADLAVGAWFEWVGGVEKVGRVYVLWGPDFGTFTVLEPTRLIYHKDFGAGLAAADFTGDGIDDLAVSNGCGGDPPTPGAFGFVDIFCGGASFSTTACTALMSAGTGLEGYVFGGLMKAGDIDGDSIPDLVVAVPQAEVNGLFKGGHIEVFHGPAYGSAQVVENPAPHTLAQFGNSLSLADVSGDGVLDIVVGTSQATVNGVTQAGRLHVLDGPTLAVLATIENPSPTKNDRFGEGSIGGDLDGDGQAELIASDVKRRLYVVRDPLGDPQITVHTKPPTPNPTPAAASFGYFFAVSDVNGDGLTDIVIADPFEGDALACGLLPAGGAIYVSLGPYFSTYTRVPSPTSACGDAFSWNLITADMDDDGHPDIVAGNSTADSSGIPNAGSIVIMTP